MRKPIVASSLTGLMILTAIVFAFSGKARRSTRSINEVLQAHHVTRTSDVFEAYLARAKRLTHYPVPPGVDSPGYFERMITVAVEKEAFRRDNLDPLGLRTQIDLFGGQSVYRADIQQGQLGGSARSLDESESRAVQSAVKLFGIMPVLKQLQATGGEAVSISVGEDGQETFAVNAGSDEWTLFIDNERLIRRLQMTHNEHHLTIDYSDYREIDGVQLSFVQRVSAEGTLLYELFFDRIDLIPTFPDGFFSREGFTRENTR